MSKIKRILNENRVLLVLGIILILCLVIVSVVALTYFYGSSDSVYGDRLNVTTNAPLSDKLLKDIKDELENNEKVKSASVDFKEIIVYINITFVDDTKMKDAKSIAEGVIELFNEDELAVYDIQFTINSLSTSEANAYTLMGARNANGNGNIIWNNYNIDKESSESK